MTESIDPKTIDKPVMRCTSCDREVVHYNTFIAPSNIESVICWQCLARNEKGFNAKSDFSRHGRRGVVPR